MQPMAEAREDAEEASATREEATAVADASSGSGSKDGARSSSDTAARTTLNNSNGTAETEVDDEVKVVECFVDGCHEVVELAEMVYHLDLHTALDYQKKADKTDKPDKTTRPQSGDGAQDKRRRRRKNSYHSHRRKDSSSSASKYSPKSPTAISRTASHASRHTHRNHRLSHVGDENDEASQNPHRERRDQERNSTRKDREHSRSRGHRHKHSHDRHDRSSRDDRDKDAARSRPTTRDERAKESAASTAPSTPSHASTRPKSLRLNWWPFRFSSEAKKPAHHHQPAPSAGSALAPPKPKKRLGRAELGKYAHEERMPEWLAVYLKKEWGVCHSGTIPVLHHLLEQSPTTEYAYLCDPCVKHVSRLQKEGGFCGYRNIQTVVSYIVGAKSPGHNLFGDDLPSIFDIQNIIENAWDMGINAQGRVETGGIRWTRKYIGTPEAMAMFRSLNIPCNAQAFNHTKTGRAADMLVREVERYFEAGKPLRPGNKVRATSLPPIYWQHPGHSLTIVGIEKTTAGQVNLLVFDPVIRHGWPLLRLPGMRSEESPDRMLKLYRRGPRYMYKYRAFEILKLDPKSEDLRPIEIVPPLPERNVEDVVPLPERHAEDVSPLPEADVEDVSPPPESR